MVPFDEDVADELDVRVRRVRVPAVGPAPGQEALDALEGVLGDDDVLGGAVGLEGAAVRVGVAVEDDLALEGADGDP